jgi:hypothetical protein
VNAPESTEIKSRTTQPDHQTQQDESRSQGSQSRQQSLKNRSIHRPNPVRAELTNEKRNAVFR